MKKTLYRSTTNKAVLGLLGGIGEFFSIDPMLIRVGYIILMFVTGFFPGALAYLVCALIVPVRPVPHEDVIHAQAHDVPRGQPKQESSASPDASPSETASDADSAQH